MDTPTRQELVVDEPGVLSLGGLRFLIVSPTLLAEIQKGVEDRLGSRASEYLYAAGSTWAAHECRRLRPLAAEPAALAHLFCQLMTGLGLGRWVVRELQPDARMLTLQVERSPLAEAYGTSDQPVCHALAGAVSALGEALLRCPCAAIETHCKAQGAPACQFTIRAQEVEGSAWGW